MKRVISLVLCLMLVLGLAATASAATVVNNVDGHNFEIYQVFSGTQSGTDANLGNIVWGTGVNGSDLLTDLKTLNATKAYFESIEDNELAAENVAGVLAHKDTPVDVINQFAQLAYNNRTNMKQAISAGEYEVPAGYYMIVDVTALADGDAYNPALLQVTNAGDITISKKYDVPEHDKSVIADDNGDHGGHVDMEDSPIGKPVDFHLKAEMPLNMTGFEKYTMTFHDDLSEGLTLQPETIELWVGGTKVEDTTKYSVKVNSTETPLVCDKDGGSYACDFHVVVTDVMAIDGYAPGCEVVVKYKAILNENAVINENGNPNNYRLEYSNDPNWDPDDPDTPSTPPTGVTPWNEVKVYTTEVEILKVDGTTDQPLTGAEFTLTGTAANVVKVTKNEFVPYTVEDEANGETKYWELKDGTYTTTDPATPDLDTTNYVDTTVVYSNKTTTKFVGAGKEQTEIKAYVGNDGIVKFAGLGEGTYTVTETDVPDGYNGLKSPMTLTIVFHEAEERWEYSWTGGATGSGASIQVDNMKGSVLPETGGIGTTLFYVIGGLLFASSAVLLVTKKRMTAE